MWEYPTLTGWLEVVTEGPLGKKSRKWQTTEEYNPHRARNKSHMRESERTE